MPHSGLASLEYVTQKDGYDFVVWLSCTGSFMSQCMRFTTMWCVRPAKPQMSLRIRAVWSEPLLVA